MLSNVENELSLRGNCIIRTKGISMEPLLHENESSVVLVPVHHPLKKNDVVLFRRSNGQLVLHRIISVATDTYTIRGDNCVGCEKVFYNQVIAVMSGYYRSSTGRLVPVGCFRDQVYIALYRVMWQIKRIIRLLFRAIRNILRMPRKGQ